MSKELKKKAHCIVPWTSLYIQHDGNVFPCCRWTRFTPIGNLHKQNLQEIWNSSELKKLRLDMLNNTPVGNCEDCRFNELSGQKSLRHEYLEEQADFLDRALETKEDGSYEELSPVFLSYAVGTECQLRCRMCGPHDSNSWRAEVGYNNNIAPISNTISASRALELVGINKTLTRVLFVGGEPIIIPLHYEILDALLNSKKEKVVELVYNSNLVQLNWKNYNVIDFWNKFSKVKLFVSIDGVNDQFNFIRTGHTWEKLLANLNVIKKDCKTVETSAYITLSLYNFLYIPEIIEELLSKNLFTINQIHFNRVSFPLMMNSQNAPAELKALAKLKYKKYMRKLLREYDYDAAIRIVASLSLLLRYMSSVNDDSAQFMEFIAFNKNSKSIPNHWDTFKKQFPELLLLTV